VKSSQSAFWKMVPFTRVSGSLCQTVRAKKMEEVFRYGLMALDTTASGATAWPTGSVVSCTPRATSTKENGLKIKQMAMVFTLISTAVDTRASGLLINNMDLASSNGQMEPNMTASTNKE